jgi:predicted ATPase
MRGWVLAAQGAAEEGIEQLRQGLAIWQDIGTELGLTYLLARLVEVYGEGGQAEEGLRILAEALAAADKNGERWWEAELHHYPYNSTLAIFPATR